MVFHVSKIFFIKFHDFFRLIRARIMRVYCKVLIKYANNNKRLPLLAGLLALTPVALCVENHPFNHLISLLATDMSLPDPIISLTQVGLYLSTSRIGGLMYASILISFL